MLRRFVTVAFALVLAVFGTGAVVVYARTSDSRAVAGERPEIKQAPAAIQVEAATPLTIPAGKLAISVELPLARQAGGNVSAGSQVAVFAVVATAPEPADEAVTAPLTTRLLLPSATVLAIGPNAFSVDKTPSAGGTLVTFALTQPEIERLLQAGSTGALHLALLGAGAGATPGPGVGPTTLFPAPVVGG